jgi:hypothetical protein
VSHGHLVAFVAKYHDAGLCRIYKKDQLICLCKAYGVDRTSRCNKKVLSRRLMNEIKSKPHVLDILPIDDRQYMITENVSSDGHILIRVSGTVLNNRIIDSHCIHVHLIQTSWPLNFFWILIQFPFNSWATDPFKTRSIIAYFLAGSYLRFSKCYEVENTTIRFSVKISTNSYR